MARGGGFVGGPTGTDELADRGWIPWVGATPGLRKIADGPPQLRRPPAGDALTG